MTMKEKIKILVIPSDTTGVGRFRSITPHTFLQDKYGDDFHVDIDYEPKINDVNYWKQYDIVHFHRTIGPDYNQSVNIINFLKSSRQKLYNQWEDKNRNLVYCLHAKYL